MPTEIVVEAEDRPGVVADLGELLGLAGVNITAAAAFTSEGHGYVHVVVEEADHAVEALRKESWRVLSVREVLCATLDDRPGELGRFARRLARAGINITSLYIAGGTAGDKEIVVGVDDLPAALPHL